MYYYYKMSHNYMNYNEVINQIEVIRLIGLVTILMVILYKNLVLKYQYDIIVVNIPSKH